MKIDMFKNQLNKRKSLINKRLITNYPNYKLDSHFLSEYIKQKGFTLTQITDGQKFHDAIVLAKKNTPYSGFVDAYSNEEYSKMKLFLINDGIAGVAIKNDGGIVSIFKNPVEAKKQNIDNVADVLIGTAITFGGNHLDAFDGFLPELYTKYGFIPYAKIKFNIGFAPKDWNYNRDKEPDVIFFVHNGDPVERIILKKGSYKKFNEYKLKYSDSYQTANNIIKSLESKSNSNIKLVI